MTEIIELVEPQEQAAPNFGPLDVIGVIVESPPLGEDGQPVGDPVALPGWHVNAPWPVAGWDAWTVTPKTPRRVFGGGRTVHYTFADEAEFLGLLESADLSEPAPEPPSKLKGVLFDGVWCSATLDDQSGLVAVITAYQLAKTNFQPTAFHFANGNVLTINKDNIMRFVSVWMPFRQSFFKP